MLSVQNAFCSEPQKWIQGQTFSLSNQTLKQNTKVFPIALKVAMKVNPQHTAPASAPLVTIRTPRGYGPKLSLFSWKATLASSLLPPACSHSLICNKQAKQAFLKVLLVLFCFDFVTHLQVLTHNNRTGEMTLNWGMRQEFILEF